MQQRRLRLGDILDDYCPRERRITNHVVVAMVDEDVKQTRCSTCDAEHEYKQAKVPAPRRKKTGALHDIPEGARPAVVPASVHDPLLDPPADDFTMDADADIDAPVAADPEHADEPLEASGDPEALSDESEGEDESDREDDGFVHRRLIRATLPRPEGHVPERKEPEFTIHRQGGRDFNGNRPGQRRPRGARHAQGQPQQGGQNRFGGQRQGAGAPRHGSGAPHGQGQGQGGQRQGGNRPGQPGQPGQRGGRPGGQNRGGGRKRGR
jgi:hypothetical protein